MSDLSKRDRDKLARMIRGGPAPRKRRGKAKKGTQVQDVAPSQTSQESVSGDLTPQARPDADLASVSAPQQVVPHALSEPRCRCKTRPCVHSGAHTIAGGLLGAGHSRVGTGSRARALPARAGVHNGRRQACERASAAVVGWHETCGLGFLKCPVRGLAVQRSADDVAYDNFRAGMLRGRIEEVLEVWHAGRGTPGAERIVRRQGRLVGLLADGREIADCARELEVERATIYADLRVLARGARAASREPIEQPVGSRWVERCFVSHQIIPARWPACLTRS